MECVSLVLLDLIFSVCPWVFLFVSFWLLKIQRNAWSSKPVPKDGLCAYKHNLAILLRKGIALLLQRCKLWCPLLVSTAIADPLSGCSSGSQRNYFKTVDRLRYCKVWGGTWPLHLSCLVYLWRSQRFSAALSNWFLGYQGRVSCYLKVWFIPAKIIWLVTMYVMLYCGLCILNVSLGFIINLVPSMLVLKNISPKSW